MRWNDVRVCIHKNTEFNQRLSALVARGGRAQQAAAEVTRILTSLHAGHDPNASLFDVREPALPDGYRYDLLGRHRLVLSRHGDTLWFITVGTHSDVEAWLARNRGLRLAVDEAGAIEPIWQLELEEVASPALDNTGVPGERPLLALLDDDERLSLGLDAAQAQRLGSLHQGSSNEQLLEAVLDAFRLEADQAFFLSVLRSLRDRPRESTSQLLRVRAGVAVEASEEPGLLARTLDDRSRRGGAMSSVVDLRDLRSEELQQLLSGRSFRDWMLYLHPDQRRVTNGLYDRPVLLQGVSGSGKTCVLVHRALHLARSYPGTRVGVFTLNRSLANLIRDLIDTLVPASLRARIDVMAVYDLAERVVKHFEPTRLLREMDPKSGETVDRAWEDFWIKLQDRGGCDPSIDSLRKQRINASRYLRDELIWVRSAFATSSAPGLAVPPRVHYLDPAKAVRKGREVRFLAEWRQAVLAELPCWEEYLEDGGLVDHAGMTLTAHGIVPRLKSGESHPFQYRAVLVDEVQDLATVELELLSATVDTRAPDALFLAGDSKQQVFPKEHDLRKAGLVDIERRYFRKNYRNPRQILEAGVAILEHFGGSDVDGEDVVDLQNPEYSARECPRPLYVRAASEEEERRAVAARVRARRAVDDAPLCVVACGIRDDDTQLLEALRKQYAAVGLELCLLSQQPRLAPRTVFLSALETVKGFEFSTVFITRCTSQFMPDRGMPVKEHWRDARRLYVALTRARDEVVLTHSGEPSHFLETIQDRLRWCEAATLLR